MTTATNSNVFVQLVTDDHQRFKLFEDAARELIQTGNREAAGLLGTNLAQSMNSNGRPGNSAVQEAFLRHSIHAFPENPFPARALGYRFEQSGKELKAINLYREGLARSPERLDLRLLLASSCSPFLSDADQGDMRCNSTTKF